MKLFIWLSASYVTDNYHDDGGVAVCATDLERARELLHAQLPAPQKEKDALSEVFTSAPDRVFDLSGDAAEEVLVFPNAGYC